MKILLCSKDGCGAWFMLRLLSEGHSVDYYHYKPSEGRNVLDGIIPVSLKAKPDFAKYDLVIFDVTGNPKLAEEALALTPTIGDGNLNSTLEDDRFFGIDVMEEVGINVPPYEAFDNISEAKRFIRKTNKRYVFKPNTEGEEQDCATTYVSKSAEDLLEYLDKLSAMSHGVEFILQEVVLGTEVSTEGYFNGEEFFLINATLEEKKFMEGNRGPNTGCSGNLIWAYEQEPYIFKEGLGKMKDWLRQAGFRGMIDLNTIVTATKVYGLEWTPRFGYDASATLFNIIGSNLGEFFGAIASGVRPNYQLSHNFGAAIRLSIPPYPSSCEGFHPEGVPIKGINPEECERNCYLYDAMLDKSGDLVTAGESGFIGCPIQGGASIEEAFARVMQQVKNIQIPDVQYRGDIEKTTMERYKILQSQGWLR